MKITTEEFDIETARRQKAVKTMRAWRDAHPDWKERQNKARQIKSAEYQCEKLAIEQKEKALREGDISIYDINLDRD